jgi:hypothetical protein
METQTSKCDLEPSDEGRFSQALLQEGSNEPLIATPALKDRLILKDAAVSDSLRRRLHKFLVFRIGNEEDFAPSYLLRENENDLGPVGGAWVLELSDPSPVFDRCSGLQCLCITAPSRL